MKLAIGLAIALIVSGCAQPIIKTEIVTVDKPIPVIPKPPVVPPFVSHVDTLVDADITDPGKVGQAYKYDMMQLRQLVRIYEQIIAQYQQSSASFDQLKVEIDKLYTDINKK